MPVHLNNSNKPIVARHFPQLDSTNAEALRQLRSPDNRVPNFTVFTTDHQTLGRGQSGNGWHASAGQNILASLVYYPKQLAVSDLFVLTQLSSLAVADTVSNFLATDVLVKWPNDIYVSSSKHSMVNKVAMVEHAITAKKIAGLLIQNSLMGQYLQWSVIGIGLNVNEIDFPDTLRSSATSMKICKQGEDVAVEAVKNQLFATLRTNLDYYLNPLKRKELKRDYLSRLYRLDVQADYLNVATNDSFRGTIRGVTESGHLLVEHSIGRMQQYGLKEITFL